MIYRSFPALPPSGTPNAGERDVVGSTVIVLTALSQRIRWGKNQVGLYSLPLKEWYSELVTADYGSFQELQAKYPKASLVGDDRVVFDILGNQYRLVVRMVFEYKAIQIKWFGTHAEYDRVDVKTVQYKKR